MKKAILVLMAILMLTATCWAQEKAKGEDVSITGKLTCTFCNLATPSKTCSKQCCQDCIKAGDPPLLADAKGNLYILLAGDKMKPLMTPDKLELVQSNVKVTGIMVKRNGLQGIYVKKMEKAQ